jgi:hypothetical protein
MKKFLSLAAIALLCTVIPPRPCFAQTAIQSQTVQGNYITTGAQIGVNVDPIVATAIFDFSATGTYFVNNIPTNIQLLGIGGPNGSGTYSGIAEIPIQGFSVQCMPYNATLAAAPPPTYPYTTETDGIGGGTLTFEEIKQTTGAAVVIGSLVLPPSPHGGPYVDYATVALAKPYIPTAGSMITANITAISGSVINQYSICYMNVTLQ